MIKRMTLDEHKRFAEKLLSSEADLLKCQRDYDEKLSSLDRGKISTILNKLGFFKMRMEDRLFKEHPYLENQVGFSIYNPDQTK